MPYWRIEVERGGGHGVTRLARADCAASLRQASPGSAMNCAVDATSAEQGLIGAGDDRVDSFLRDVSLD